MKYLSWFTSGAVLIVAAAAFVLAFHNVTGLAMENGVIKSLAWLVPIIVEGAMLALAFTRLEAEVNGRQTGWQVAGIVAFVVLAIALNVAHSNMTTWGVIIAGLQPVSLLVAFEAFMYQLRHRLADNQQAAVNPWRVRAKVLIAYARCQQTAVTDLQSQNRELQTAVTDLGGQNKKLFDANKELQIFNRRWQSIGNERQIIVRANAGEISEQQAADMTGRDIRTVRSWMEQMNGAVK